MFLDLLSKVFDDPLNSNRAVFLDRDGTIIRDGHFIKEAAQVELLHGSIEGFALLRNANYMIFLFTNQSGVGRGYFTLEEVHCCNMRMEELLQFPRPVFDGICIAPEAPGQPVLYRKPSPRYIEETVTKHNLDKTQCWMVGDKRSDIEAGLLAGINTALVGHRQIADLPAAVQRFDSLLDFALVAVSDGKIT